MSGEGPIPIIGDILCENVSNPYTILVMLNLNLIMILLCKTFHTCGIVISKCVNLIGKTVYCGIPSNFCSVVSFVSVATHDAIYSILQLSAKQCCITAKEE
jgi:hypothetical protein